MSAVETVKVSRPDLPGGYLIINKSDFDPGKMKLYQEGDANHVHGDKRLRKQTERRDIR